MGYIKKADREQIILLPDCIDDYISEDNAVRVIDAYVDGLSIETFGFTMAEPCETGRPPYSPCDLLKLYIYGYMNRVRSSRRLEKETKRNLEVIWLLGKLSPDHKTISRFRHDNADALKKVFRNFVKLCMSLGLYGRELAAIDGSKFKAVNSIDRNFSVSELEERVKRLTARIDEYLRQMNETDAAEEVNTEKTPDEIKQIIEKLSTRKTIYELYLEEMMTNGETQKSLTDPDARLMRDKKGFDVSYNVQTSVDAKHKLIAEFAVTSDGNDMQQLSNMALATAEILESPNLTATADTGYNNASEVARCVENGIMPQVIGFEGDFCVSCAPEQAEEIIAHKNGKCVYLKERNVVVCPMGHILPPMHYKCKQRMAIYYNYNACQHCTCRCTKTKYRQFAVRMKKADFSKNHNIENLFVKQIHITPNRSITDRRKELSEHPFGTIKRAMEAGYVLTRGLQSVAGEFSLLFLAYNLKRAINIIGIKALLERMRSIKLAHQTMFIAVKEDSFYV
jgi:transposase